MAVSSSIQFRGKDAAIQAFQNRKVDLWSLWQGKQFLTKGAGDEELEAYLDMLLNAATNAIYTVRVYEDITDLSKIKSNTPDDGSFNFRLSEDPAAPIQYSVGAYRNNTEQMMQLLQRMDQRLAKLEEEDEEEETSEEEVLSIAGFLKEPEKLGRVISVAKQILGINQPAQNFNHSIGTVSRVGQTETGGQAPAADSGEKMAQTIEEEKLQKLQRLGAAIDTLERNDPKLIDHLEKLASIAAKDKAKFQSLVSMLDIWN